MDLPVLRQTPLGKRDPADVVDLPTHYLFRAILIADRE
jgi:hypothetical protein